MLALSVQSEEITRYQYTCPGKNPIRRGQAGVYSRIRMETVRRDLDEIAARQRDADENRKKEVEQKQAAAASQPELVQ